mmetsp:Transcript_89044/g.287966  ORF Transcript_89044/g.287966 Transcript_89044/m.287966 type:complete len:125 (-) Transcript_89044:131-505(-)
MALLGEGKLSEVKIVKVVRSGGFAGLLDTEKLKGRKELLALGREFKLQALQVVVHIDRSLGVRSDIQVPQGTTIRALKDRLCAKDPTGTSKPEAFTLQVAGSNTALPDDSRLSSDTLELELHTS